MYKSIHSTPTNKLQRIIFAELEMPIDKDRDKPETIYREHNSKIEQIHIKSQPHSNYKVIKLSINHHMKLFGLFCIEYTNTDQ